MIKRKIQSGFIILFLLFQMSLTITTFQQNQQEPKDSDAGEREVMIWLPPDVVSTESTDGSYLGDACLSQSGNIHVAWQDVSDYQSAGMDMDIFYKKWDASTRLWTVTEVVTPFSTEWIMNKPIIRVDSEENVYILWDEPSDEDGSGPDQDIFMKCFNSSLSYWMDLEVVTYESNNMSYSPYLEIDYDDNLHLVWGDSLDIMGEGDANIYYKTRDALSGDWSEAEVVSLQSILGGTKPKMVIDNNNTVHVVFIDMSDIDGDAQPDLFYSFKDGSTWSLDALISTESTQGVTDHEIACDINNNIHVVWADDTDYNGADSDFDIFYKYLDSAANLWTTTYIVSTESSGESSIPDLVCDGAGDVHFLWSDNTNYFYAGADSDIFYKNYNILRDEWTLTDVVTRFSSKQSSLPVFLVDKNGYYTFYCELEPLYDSGDDKDVMFQKLIFPPETPIITPIFPNPTANTEINLNWTDCEGATSYYLYRSSEYITSIDDDDLIPIAKVDNSSYIDHLPDDGVYYYTVVAGNVDMNGTMSNVVDILFDKSYFNFGLGGLIILIAGFGLIQIVTMIINTRINSKKTQKLLQEYSIKPDAPPLKESSTESDIKPIKDVEHNKE